MALSHNMAQFAGIYISVNRVHLPSKRLKGTHLDERNSDMENFDLKANFRLKRPRDSIPMDDRSRLKQVASESQVQAALSYQCLKKDMVGETFEYRSSQVNSNKLQIPSGCYQDSRVSGLEVGKRKLGANGDPIEESDRKKRARFLQSNT